MNAPHSHDLESRTVEGIARVVRIEGTTAWLEPEQTSSCGSCASSGSCGTGAKQAPGIGTVTNRLAARQFPMDNPPGYAQLREGDRIVIGVDNRALVSGSLIAYALPLVCAFVAAGVAQGMYQSDPATIVGMVGGLLAGLFAARIFARRLSAQGALAPRFLRRALPGETCGTP